MGRNEEQYGGLGAQSSSVDNIVSNIECAWRQLLRLLLLCNNEGLGAIYLIIMVLYT